MVVTKMRFAAMRYSPASRSGRSLAVVIASLAEQSTLK
jgi:hypothetical protein